MSDKAEGNFDAVVKNSGTIFQAFFKGISGADFNGAVAAMTNPSEGLRNMVAQVFDGEKPPHIG